NWCERKVMEKGTTFLSKKSAFQRLICRNRVTCLNKGVGISHYAVSEQRNELGGTRKPCLPRGQRSRLMFSPSPAPPQVSSEHSNECLLALIVTAGACISPELARSRGGGVCSGASEAGATADATITWSAPPPLTRS